MKKVLIVEDSAFIANAVKLVLKSGDIESEHISDGSKVQNLVKSGSFGLVILDLMMPGVSGKDVLLALKKDEKTKKIPVLILSAKTDALKWDDELKACDKFMTKPFDNKVLLETAKKMMK